jgi:hypothetical protein
LPNAHAVYPTTALLKSARLYSSLSHLEEFGALASELREWKLECKEPSCLGNLGSRTRPRRKCSPDAPLFPNTDGGFMNATTTSTGCSNRLRIRWNSFVEARMKQKPRNSPRMGLSYGRSVVPVLGCVMLPEENLSRFSSCLAIAQSRPPNDIWVVAKGSHAQSMTRSVSSQPPALPRPQVAENTTCGNKWRYW